MTRSILIQPSRLVLTGSMALFLAIMPTGCQTITPSGLFGSSTAASSPEEAFDKGLAYTSGAGVEQDYARGLRYFEQAAAAGHVEAAYFSGVAYSTGRGTAPNAARAASYLTQAANAGHARSQFLLGNMKSSNDLGEQDLAAALQLYEAAARQGHGEAQLAAGLFRATGRGGPTDLVAAAAWLILADDQNVETADKALSTVMGKLNPSQRRTAQQRVSTLVQRG